MDFQGLVDAYNMAAAVLSVEKKMMTVNVLTFGLSAQMKSTKNAMRRDITTI